MASNVRGNSILKNSDRIAVRTLYRRGFAVIATWAQMPKADIVANEPLSNLGKNLAVLEKGLIKKMPQRVTGENGVIYESDAADFDATWTAAGKAGHLATVEEVMNVLCATYCQVSP